MLYTNLKHIENAEEYKKIISENENVTIICGRMGPLCIPVYRIAEELEEEYKHVQFFDIEYDNPESFYFHALPEVKGLLEYPFIVYFKNGEVVNTSGGIQTKTQMQTILDHKLAPSMLNYKTN